MSRLSQTHTSAKPSHYNKEAEFYDQFNEKSMESINQLIEKTLRKHKVKSVLDLTCGTGSQVFYLENKGYEIVGSDINTKMLAIAKEKAKHSGLDIPFRRGDMRTTQAGKFDAVITIFNAVGHLTKTDFIKAIKNIYKNLNAGGIYIFDNFNLDYLQYQDNITQLTIDGQRRVGGVTRREIQYSTINNSGILASTDIYLEQQGNNKPTRSTAFQTLQVYSSQQITNMLQSNGFDILRLCNTDGGRFSKTRSERFLVIAKK